MAENGAIGDGKTIAVITNGFNVYPRYLATGVRKALEGTGYKCIGRQSGFDTEREVDNFEEMVALGVDGIVVMPHTIESAERGYRAAKNAGIPIVNLLWYGPSAVDDAFVGRVQLPNDRDGRRIAKWVTENTNPGDILLVESVLGQGFSEAFTKSLEVGLATYGGGKWRIVARDQGFYDRFKAKKAVERMLSEHPNAKIIIDYAAEMAIGIATYLAQNDRRDIVTITSDAVEEMVPWMKRGWITATRYYSPAAHGLTGARLLRDYLENDRKPDGVVEVEVADEVVTKDNLDKWLERQPLLYEEYMAEVARTP
jgi:ABC-type sugar transport system substrate-binding protein